MTIQHANRGHSLYSPSSASRWTRCPGSPKFIVKLEEEGILGEEEPSEAADLGTALHEMCDYALRQGVSLDEASAWACNEHPEFMDDISERTDDFLHYILRIRGHMEDGYDVKIEHRMDYRPDEYDVGGTADAVAYSERWNTLRIYDIKTGRIPVSAENNIQLSIYAGMAIRSVVPPDKIDGLQVILSIYQPNGECPWSEWDTRGVDIEEVFRGALQASTAPFTRENLVSKGTQCRWCRAKMHCPAYARWLGARMNPRTAKFVEELFNDR